MDCRDFNFSDDDRLDELEMDALLHGTQEPEAPPVPKEEGEILVFEFEPKEGEVK